MRDVVVIGGGLSGLSACFELEKRGAAYTVIEVKRRFGGGIRSTREGGFLMDACAFAFRRPAPGILPPEFDLQEQILAIGDGVCVFRSGTETVIRAYADRLHGGRLMRMALSSIGRLGNCFALCLENGIMLDAGALILAVPAPYAARMLWNLAPEAAEKLADFRYDSIRRVSLGFHKRDLPAHAGGVADARFPFINSTDQPGRVPDRGHKLVQLGLRCSPAATAPEAIDAVTRHLGSSASPLAARVDSWPEAHLHSPYDEGHRENVGSIRRLLPAGLSLIGSDFCDQAPESDGVARFDERILAGAQAARNAITYLKTAAKG